MEKTNYIKGLVAVSFLCYGLMTYTYSNGHVWSSGVRMKLQPYRLESDDSQTTNDDVDYILDTSYGRPDSTNDVRNIIDTTYTRADALQCQPVQHFAFTKISKTGSTTMASIFARFILKHNLTVLMPYDGVHIDWRKARHKNWDFGPGGVAKADTLISHSRYDEAMLDKYLHDDITRIVSVRDAESWMKSAVTYYGQWANRKSAEEVIRSDALMFKQRKLVGVGYWFHNVQLQWLGLHKRDVDNLTVIKQHIKYVVDRFDVPVINDQFDASLVVLRRRLCWNYTDIFYTKKIVTNSARKPDISAIARQTLLSERVNLGDQLLYEAMRAKWRASIELRHPDFWEEVDYFRELNSNVSSTICDQVMKTRETALVEENKWHPTLHITHKLCVFLTYSNNKHINLLRKWAFQQ